METSPAGGAYPVSFAAESPEHFRRSQVAVRLALLLSTSVVHAPLGGIVAALYVFIPVLVAVTVSEKAESFERREGRQLERALGWLVAAAAYLCFVTDRLPVSGGAVAARMSIQSASVPSSGGALSRLFTTLPHVVVLCVLGLAAQFVGVVAAVMIVVKGRFPLPLWKFQRNVVAWAARVLAYHASLVDEYPPFSFSGAGSDGGESARGTPARVRTS